ncbi:MAG: DUF5722 domain-containing protein [Kineothrix sp.]
MKRGLLMAVTAAFLLASSGKVHGAEPEKAGGAAAQQISAEGENACRIDSCTIAGTDRERVRVEASFGTEQALPERLYLFALPVYEDSLEGHSPIAAADSRAGQSTYVLEAGLQEGAENLLCSRFVIAAGEEGKYTPISNLAWITNPEALAEEEVPALGALTGQGGNSKKGIQVVNNILPDVEDLGVSHAFFNIVLQEVISLHPTAYYYDYGGKRYYFTDSIIQDFDSLLGTLYDTGTQITVALLSEHRGGYEFLICPGVEYRPGTFGYAWNTQDATGAGYIQATLSYLASRYNGTDPNVGKVTNWVIGNEVNDNLQYYYMGAKDRDSFVREYYKTFRIAYNAIRSGNAAANVYIPLQGRWMTADTLTDYGGRGFLETFNSLAKSEGNFNWGVAYHAYSHPISTSSILKDGTSMVDQYGNLLDAGHVTDQWNTPIITMKNINVLTDYLNTANLKTASGAVRSVILAEQGWTSVSNSGATETTQAANIALAYYKAEMNPDIDAFLLRAHVDAEEGSPYFKFGLWNCSQSNFAKSKKLAYNIFKYMDTKESLTVTGFAKSVLGISDWASVVPGFNAAKFNSMRSIEMGGIVNLDDWSKAGNRSMIAADMQGTWVNQHNTHGIGIHGYNNSYFPRGVAVTNPYAYHLSYQGLKYEPASPLNLNARPYLGFTISFQPKDAGGSNDKLLTRIRVFSGNNINDSNVILDVNRDYNLCVRLKDWEYRNSIDRIEVWVQEYGQAKSFDGTFTIYDLQCAETIGSSSELPWDATLNPEAVLFAFSDVLVIPGNWKYESIKYVYENKIMNGITATTRFDPDRPLTRGMFATVLYRMAGEPGVKYTKKFSDVADGKWYSKAIIWASQKGIVSGYLDGTFGVEQNITREQIAKMLYEYADKVAGYDVSQKKELTGFTDRQKVSPWAEQYLQWATAVSMITGKPNDDRSYRLDPKGEATRAECAAMLMRFQNKYADK